MIPPLAPICEPATVRLVPTAYYKPPVLSRLVDTAEELRILQDLEGMTNRRLQAEDAGLPDLDPRELVFKVWGRSYINAAFTYTRANGNRFNGPDRGAWYCAFDDLTAIDEVGFHRTRELTYIGHFHDHANYQALLAAFIGDFHDLRDLDEPPPCLHPDPDIGYPEGQALASTLRAQESSGIVYPSVRRPGGTCLVAFLPHLVQRVRPGARWTFVWNGTADFTVTTD